MFYFDSCSLISPLNSLLVAYCIFCFLIFLVVVFVFLVLLFTVLYYNGYQIVVLIVCAAVTVVFPFYPGSYHFCYFMGVCCVFCWLNLLVKLLGYSFGMFSHFVELSKVIFYFRRDDLKDKEFSNLPPFLLKESKNLVCSAHLIAVLAICFVLLFLIFQIGSIFLCKCYVIKLT